MGSLTHLRKLTSAGLIGLALGLCAGKSPAAATDAEDRQACDTSASNPDAGIPACTRLLTSKAENLNIPAVFINRGIAWSRKGMFDSAIQDFTEATQRNPSATLAYLHRSLAWMQKGEFDRAISDLGLAINLDRNSVQLYRLRGLALSSKGEFDRAIKDFDQAIKLNPNFEEAYLGRGGARYLRRDFDGAIADFNKAVQLNSKGTAGFIERAQVFMDKGDYARAIADYDEAIKREPKYWRSFSSRGEALRLKGDLTRSMVDHDEAIRLEPRSFDAYNNRALVWQDKGDLDRAIADFDEAILLAPNESRSYGNRGEAFRLKGELDRAVADLNKAIALVPKSSMFHCRRGDALRDRESLDQALADFDEAIRISPNATCGHLGRALVLDKKGDGTQALASLKRALAINVERDPYPPMGRVALAVAQQNLARIEAGAQASGEKTKQVATKEIPFNPGRRVALVIGNSEYKEVTALPNPRRDADAVADAFRTVGFQTVTVKYDLDRAEMLRVLNAFQDEFAQADWAVIYFAGHGIEMEGVNYVIPVDAKLKADRDVRDEAVPLERLINSVEGSKKLRLVVLDACRDNPFVKTMRRSVATRNISRGLAAIEPDGGTLVAYSAKHGQVALDGRGQHSPFVTAFINRLMTPQLEIGKLFRMVRDDVLVATGKRQEPFVYGSLSGEDYYFKVR